MAMSVPTAAQVQARTSQVAPFDAEAFAVWADRTFGQAYDAGGAFAGMGLVVVRGDDVVVERAYGLANHTTGQPIDSTQTRFLIGSISKTFVGVAIAQLVESGRIRSIDDPANLYLRRLQIGGRHNAEISVRDLLTHSAGYDQRLGGVSTHVAIEAPLSGPEIAALAPRRVRPPGALVSYSNYSTGLLATIVEDVSGLSIEQYERERIWNPLGMQNTHFETGLELPSNVASAYYPDDGGAMARAPFLPFHPYYWPVGAISASLEDMARYARFHLAAVRGQDSPVLSAAAHMQLRDILHRSHPDVGGFGFQMMAFDWNGQVVFGHGGTWPGYESMLLVFPALDVAVFFSVTGPQRLGNLSANIQVIEQVLGVYEPGRAYVSLNEEELRQYEGAYRSTLRAYSGPEALINFLQPSQRVTVKGEGLMLDDVGPLRPIGNDTFILENAAPNSANPFASPLFAFVRGEEGHVQYLVHLQGLAPLERIGPLLVPELRMQALDIAKWAGLLGLLGFFWRRKTVFDGVSKVAAIVGAPLAWLFPIVLVVGLGSGGLSAYVLQGNTARFYAVAVIGCALVASTAIIALWGLSRANRAVVTRLHAGVVALSFGVSGAVLLSMFIV